MQKQLLAFLFVALFTINCSAQTNLYVDNNVSSSGSGTTWASAYKTLNEALNVANAASTTIKYNIYIAAGMYYPTGLQSGTNRDSTFYISRGGIKLYGGYPSGGGARNTSAFLTILSGNINSNSNTDNSYHVLVASNITSSGDSIVIDGLRIRSGYADGTGSKTYNGQSISRSAGGGMNLEDIYCTMLIQDCIFNDHLASNYGAAMYQNTSTGVVIDMCGFNGGIGARGNGICLIGAGCKILNSTFTGNSGTEGAAIYQNGDPGVFTLATVVNGCTFTTNNTTATTTGGAAIFRNGAMRILNSSFVGNNAYRGGAIYSSQGSGITSCSFNGNTATMQGGAIYLNNANLLDSCRFTFNKAATAGGAVYLATDGGGSINNNYFLRDSSTSGGAIGSGSNVAISINGNRFINNIADNGGAFYKNGTGGVFDRNVFAGNRALVNGGGIYTSGSSSIKLSSCLLSGNKAGNFGGAVYLSSATTTTAFTNCTFAGDTANSGNAFYNTSSSPTITNCIIWDGASGFFNTTNSSPVVTYSTVQGGYTGANNNSTDPIFVTPVSAVLAPDTTADYRLQPCSPAVNSGTNAVSANLSLYDLDYNSRFYNTTVDRGAYEQGPVPTTPIIGGNQLCLESTLQLSHAIPGGTWTSSTPSRATINSSGLVSAGWVTGVDTITYTITAPPYCGAVAKLIITVNPIINASNSTLSSSSICEYGTLTAFNSTTGGVWSLTNTSLASISTSGVVQGISYGIDTVIYTLTNTNGCLTKRYTPFVLKKQPIAPPVTANTFTVCQNKEIVVQCARPSVSWRSAYGLMYNTITSTPVSVTSVLGILPGNLPLYAIVDSLGCSDTAIATITVLPVAPIGIVLGPNDTMCVRSSMTFTNTVPGGTWSSSNTSVASIGTLSGLITSFQPGHTIISYQTTNANGCDTFVRGTLYVVTPSATIQSQGGFLRALPENATNYQWISCDAGNASVGSGQNFTPTRDGRYKAVVTKYGCTDTSACYTVNYLGVGSLTGAGSNISIYPNPASDQVFIHHSTSKKIVIVIREITGKVVSSLTSDLPTTTVNIAGYAPGIYVVEVSDGVTKTLEKLNIVR